MPVFKRFTNQQFSQHLISDCKVTFWKHISKYGKWGKYGKNNIFFSKGETHWKAFNLTDNYAFLWEFRWNLALFPCHWCVFIRQKVGLHSQPVALGESLRLSCAVASGVMPAHLAFPGRLPRQGSGLGGISLGHIPGQGGPILPPPFSWHMLRQQRVTSDL